MFSGFGFGKWYQNDIKMYNYTKYSQLCTLYAAFMHKYTLYKYTKIMHNQCIKYKIMHNYTLHKISNNSYFSSFKKSSCSNFSLIACLIKACRLIPKILLAFSICFKKSFSLWINFKLITVFLALYFFVIRSCMLIFSDLVFCSLFFYPQCAQNFFRCALYLHLNPHEKPTTFIRSYPFFRVF